MELVKATAQDEKILVQLLRDYFILEGKEYSFAELKHLLVREVQHGHEFFLLKEGKDARGCISVSMQEGNEAEIAYLTVPKEHAAAGYDHSLLDFILQVCSQRGVATVHSVIPRAHELLFAQKGFYLHKGKVCVEWKAPVTDQQTNLQTQLDDLAHVEETSDKTAEMLRTLKTRK